MRFLHLSDLHIGRRLAQFSLLEDQRHLIDQMVAFAQECDAVLIAGDLYDKAQPSAEAVRLVGDLLTALARLHKPVLVVSGNHDSAEQVAYCRALMGECGVFVAPAYNGQPVCHTLTDEHGAVNVWLLPFVRPANVRPYHPNVSGGDEAIRAVVDALPLDTSQRNVLVGHQYVTGAAVCESETRQLGSLDEVGADAFERFDYVALGHLHSPQRLLGGKVRYSGSPLKYSLSEEHQRKAALIVTLGEKGAPLGFEERPFQPLRDVRTVSGALSDITKAGTFSEDYVFASLTDTGALIDPLGVLRLCYPNLIGLRTPMAEEAEEWLEPERMESMSPLEHFCAFYEALHGEKPDDERERAMAEIISQARGEMGE